MMKVPNVTNIDRIPFSVEFEQKSSHVAKMLLFWLLDRAGSDNFWMFRRDRIPSDLLRTHVPEQFGHLKILGYSIAKAWTNRSFPYPKVLD
jgi:hypothetical protein